MQIGRSRSLSMIDVKKSEGVKPPSKLKKQHSAPEILKKSTPDVKTPVLKKQHSAPQVGSEREISESRELVRSVSTTKISESHLKARSLPSMDELESNLLEARMDHLEDMEHEIADTFEGVEKKLHKMVFSSENFQPIQGMTRGPDGQLSFSSEVAKGMSQEFEKGWDTETRDFLIDARDFFASEEVDVKALTKLFEQYIDNDSPQMNNIYGPTREKMIKAMGPPIDTVKALKALQEVVLDVAAKPLGNAWFRYQNGTRDADMQQDRLNQQQARLDSRFQHHKSQPKVGLDAMFSQAHITALFDQDAEIGQAYFKHFETEFATENRDFLIAMRELSKQDTISLGALRAVYDKFISRDAKIQINIDGLLNTIPQQLSQEPPDVEAIMDSFVQATKVISKLVRSDSYSRFVRTPIGKKFLEKTQRGIVEAELQPIRQQMSGKGGVFQKRPLSLLFGKSTSMAQGLFKSLEKRGMSDSRDFLMAARQLINQKNGITASEMRGLYKTYIQEGSDKQVNLDDRTRQVWDQAMNKRIFNTRDIINLLPTLQESVEEISTIIALEPAIRRDIDTLATTVLKEQMDVFMTPPPNETTYTKQIRKLLGGTSPSLVLASAKSPDASNEAKLFDYFVRNVEYSVENANLMQAMTELYNSDMTIEDLKKLEPFVNNYDLNITNMEKTAFHEALQNEDPLAATEILMKAANHIKGLINSNADRYHKWKYRTTSTLGRTVESEDYKKAKKALGL